MAASKGLVRWGRHYELGNKKLDHQHHNLVDLLNHLHTQWEKDLPRTALTETLQTLVDAILVHFHTEEHLMARHHYAHYVAHKIEHDSFAAEITGFQRDFRSGKASLDEPLFHHLASWLRDHLIVSDKPMGKAIGEEH